MDLISKLVILTLVLFSFESSGQLDYRITYHPYINKAELAIIDQNYRLAFENYERAFLSGQIGFGKDYQNATMCAIEVKEYDRAIEFLEKLVSKGIEKYFFEHNRNLYKELQTHGFEEFLARFDELKQRSFDLTANFEVMGELGERENRDQEFRHDYKTFIDTIQKIDAENISSFLNIVDQYNFPSEEMLGLQSPQADNSGYHYILWHHLKNWKSDTTLTDIRPVIIEAVKKGKLSSANAASYLDLAESQLGFIGNYGSTKVIKFGDEKKLYTISYGKEEEKKINANRQMLGLGSLADLQKKLKYHFILHDRKSKFEVLKLATIDYYPSEFKAELKVKELK